MDDLLAALALQLNIQSCKVANPSLKYLKCQILPPPMIAGRDDKRTLRDFLPVEILSKFEPHIYDISLKLSMQDNFNEFPEPKGAYPPSWMTLNLTSLTHLSLTTTLGCKGFSLCLPSLTRLDAPSATFEVLMGARAQLGPKPLISIHGDHAIEIQDHLSLLFPPRTLGMVCDHLEASNSSCSDTARIVTRSDFRDALTLLIGENTYAAFHVRLPLWPPTISGIAFDRADGAPFATAFAYSSPKVITTLSSPRISVYFSSSALFGYDKESVPHFTSIKVDRKDVAWFGVPSLCSPSLTSLELDLEPSMVHLGNEPDLPIRHAMRTEDFPFQSFQPSLTRLKLSSSTLAIEWGQLSSNLPQLTELWLPNAPGPALSALPSFPSGLRLLSLRLSLTSSDREIRDMLVVPLPLLEVLELSGQDIVFTWPNSDGTQSLTPDLVPRILESYFNVNGNMRFILRHPHLLTPSIDRLPRNLTTLDLLPFIVMESADPIKRWPPQLTELSAAFGPSRSCWVGKIPLLKLHAHFPELPRIIPSGLPDTITSIILTTEASKIPREDPRRASDIKNLKENLRIVPANLPCVHVLHTLIAPEFFLDPLMDIKELDTSGTPLPNLVRLAIGVQATDLQLISYIKRYTPKLERLSITAFLELTGALVIDSDMPDVSFKTIALETRRSFLAVLQSNYKKRLLMERSSDPSSLKDASQVSNFVDERLPSSSSLQSPLPPYNAPTASENLLPEFNCGILVNMATKANAFYLPKTTTRLVLSTLTTARRHPPMPVYLEFTKGGGQPADEVEGEIRRRSDVNFVHISLSFSSDSLANLTSLEHLEEIQYETKLPFHPSLFQHETLQTMVILSPITLSIHANTAQWTLPSNLTRLQVKLLEAEVTFCKADGSPSESILTLELPNYTWKGQIPLPPNLRRLVVSTYLPVASGVDENLRRCKIIRATNLNPLDRRLQVPVR